MRGQSQSFKHSDAKCADRDSVSKDSDAKCADRHSVSKDSDAKCAVGDSVSKHCVSAFCFASRRISLTTPFTSQYLDTSTCRACQRISHKSVWKCDACKRITLYIKNMPVLFPSIKSKGQVRSACTAKWQPCVRACKKKHYLPVLTATNSASKRCQVSVDVSFQSPSCFQRKKRRSFSSKAKGGRPHRLLLGGVQSKQRRNHLRGGNVLMCAANFQNFIVTTLTMAKMQIDVLYSVYACVPRMQNHMPRRRPIYQIILFLTLLFFWKASRV